MSSSYDDCAKQIRNALRPYRGNSIVATCLKILHRDRRDAAEALKSLPWLILLVVKLILEDESIDFVVGETCPESKISWAISSLWQALDAHNDAQDENIYLSLRSLLHTQLQFQIRESYAFLRWPALIAELPVGHPSRLQFQQCFHVEPKVFCAIALVLHAGIFSGKNLISQSYLNPLRAIYGDALDLVIDHFAKDVFFLRGQLRRELHERIYDVPRGKKIWRKGANARPVTELVEFPWIARYPLLKHYSGNLVVWHPRVFARGMEDSVHTALSDLGERYTHAFSKVFEQYVLRLTASMGLPFHDEKALRGGVKSRSAVEAVIPTKSCNVFIEAKMSLFHDILLTSDQAPEVLQKLKRPIGAVVQAWKVGEQLRDGSVPLAGVNPAKQDFLIVVTSRQLNLCSGEHLSRMFGTDFFKELKSDTEFASTDKPLQLLPPQNIFFISIEEFEHLAGAVRDRSIMLEDLLYRAAIESADPQSSSFHFDQILAKQVTRWRVPDLIRRAQICARRELRSIQRMN